MEDNVWINKVYFDWYSKSEHNEKAFGQIQYYDNYDEKIDCHNIDAPSENIFRLMYELYYQNCNDDVEVYYTRN